MRVAHHSGPDLGVDDIAQGGDKAEEEEQGDVQHEDDYRDELQPVPVVGQLVQHDGQHARAHCYDEPSGACGK